MPTAAIQFRRKPTVARPRISQRSASKLLFDKAKELQYSTFLNLQLDETFAIDNIPVPFHTGAIAYYEANGLTID